MVFYVHFVYIFRLCQDSWRAKNMEVLSCASASILENDHEKNNTKFGSHFIRVDRDCSWRGVSKRQSSRAVLPCRRKALSLPLIAYLPAEGTKSVPLLVPSAGVPAPVAYAL